MADNLIKKIKNSEFKFKYKGDDFIFKYIQSLNAQTLTETTFNGAILKKQAVAKIFHSYRKIWTGSKLYSSQNARILLPDHVKQVFFLEYKLMIKYNDVWYAE